MRWPIPLFFIPIFLGCAETTISKEELRHLNGYWEISAVEFPDGSQKNYGINPTIEFIQWGNNQGFRKKVQPKFDGTYNTSSDIHDVAFLHVTQVGTSFILQYSNEFDDWEEILVYLDSLSFSVRNAEGILYAYKRFQPISIPK